MKKNIRKYIFLAKSISSPSEWIDVDFYNKRLDELHVKYKAGRKKQSEIARIIRRVIVLTGNRLTIK